ncbi:hypothetical protein [Pseudomonas koreensis]|uniref:hypothetical protein n=2 Tax=Pseudomonas TaxID=286 RepID=UPI00209EBD81|nr:hypothetical protein [Pseudomonas koreensis]MCP1477475.1 hypothetical protein [Pseudomonas koreensis]
MAYSYFAFLDVMGYRYYLSKDESNGTEVFKEKLITSYRAFEQIDLATLRHKSISDSLFMSSSTNIVGFLKATKDVYLRFLENGLLIRGGIAYNKHFENQHITYSHALTDAYNLESSKSLFPRILIHKSVIEKLKNESQGQAQSQELDQLIAQNLILRCGEHYQLHVVDTANWKDVYENARSVYLENEIDIKKDPKIFEYHTWLQNYIFHFKPSRSKKQKYIDSFQFLN